MIDEGAVVGAAAIRLKTHWPARQWDVDFGHGFRTREVPARRVRTASVSYTSGDPCGIVVATQTGVLRLAIVERDRGPASYALIQAALRCYPVRVERVVGGGRDPGEATRAPRASPTWTPHVAGGLPNGVDKAPLAADGFERVEGASEVRLDG